MEEVKLTVSQVAQEIGEPVYTVRNWLKEFRPYIPVEKSPGGYNLFNQEAINVINRIKKMYREQNLSTRQIEAILSGADKPTVPDDPVQTWADVRELLEEQRKFNVALLERLDQQRQQFEDFVRRRDEQLIMVLRELREGREQKRLPGRRQSWLKRWLKGI